MRARALPLLILGLLVLAGTAQALTISTTGTFASTRSGDVTWATDVVLEISTLQVTAAALIIDGFRMDIEPTGGGSAHVQIDHWSSNRRDIRVTGSDIVRVLKFQPWSGNWQPVINGVGAGLCNAQQLCELVMPSSADTIISFRLGGGFIGSGGAPAAEGGGGLGLSSASKSAGGLPNPFDLFPHFTAGQWGTFLIGFVLILSAIPRTARYVPIPIPLPRLFVLAGGITVLLVLYLSAAAATA